MKKILLFYILTAAIVSCKPKLEAFTPSPGDANFSKYVALGNSLTAGYSDGALYKEGQLNSYTNILAKQFQLVGGGPFKIPLMPNDNGIGINNGNLIMRYTLQYKKDCMNNTSLSPASKGPGNPADLAPITSQGPFNNLGVPGAKSFHLLSSQFGGASGNPFYTRFASAPGTSTVIGDAIAQNPTFFTLWIGNNDVLLYAAGGGEEGTDTITSPPVYGYYLGAILNTLKTTNAKGAIANIPNVTDIPYFNTVPYNALALSDANQITQLNGFYAAYFPGSNIHFQQGANPFVIKDNSGTVRQIKSNEYILLTVPQDSIKCAMWGSLKPIPGEYVLDEQEVNKIQSTVDQYNVTISSFASSFGLALVDANSLMKTLKSGINFQGVTLTAEFVKGGAFSLDGIHLTPIGNAVVANEFIKAINAKYSAQIPLVNAADYHGVEFP